MLADSPACVHCLAENADPIEVATVADHVPPLALHDHVEGSGCCQLQPSCRRHSDEQGVALSRMLKRAGVPVEIEYDEPDPTPGADSPVWDALTWLDELRDVPTDATWPLWMTYPHPRAVGTYGPEFEAWCASYNGTRLRWFQRLFAYRLLEHDAEGSLVWARSWLSVARQVGKSRVVFLVMLWAASRVSDFWSAEQTMLCSRTLRNAELLLEPYLRLADRTEGFERSRRGGEKWIEHPSGGRFTVRAIDSSYGETNGLVALDEAWAFRSSQVAESIEPTLLDSEGAMLVTSTAHRKATSFALNYRSLGFDTLDTPDEYLVVEWGARRERMLDDRDGWREASPVWTAYRERMLAGRLTAARSGEQLDPDEPDPLRAFEAQYLNRWPVRHMRRTAGDRYVEDGAWASILSTNLDPRYGRIAAIEDNYGRGLAVAVAGYSTTGRLAVTGRAFMSSREGWQYAHDLANIDSYVIGATLLGEPLATELYPVEMALSKEWRGSLTRLRELVDAHELTHDGDPEMARQMLGARVRESSGGGLVLVGAARVDLVKATAWSVDAVYRRAAGVGGIS